MHSNSMLNNLRQNYNQTRIQKNNQTQKTRPSRQNKQSIQDLSSIFSIQDQVEISQELQQIQMLARNFRSDFSQLGEAMVEYSIITKEEKEIFDKLYKDNPAPNEQLAKQTTLNNKINAIRYFGGF